MNEFNGMFFLTGSAGNKQIYFGLSAKLTGFQVSWFVPKACTHLYRQMVQKIRTAPIINHISALGYFIIFADIAEASITHDIDVISMLPILMSKRNQT